MLPVKSQSPRNFPFSQKLLPIHRLCKSQNKKGSRPEHRPFPQIKRQPCVRRFPRRRWVSLGYSFSVGVNGRPRSPLNCFFNRRSLELLLRRMISGATRLPNSRRARRPLSQSAQLMEPSIGMQGIFDFEFIGDFIHQLNALREVTIFR